MKKVRNADKRIKVAITMPPQLMREIEEQAKNENRNRSNMVCEALRQYLISKGQVQA